MLSELCPLEAHLWKLQDRKSTRLNSSHLVMSYAVFCLKKKKIIREWLRRCANKTSSRQGYDLCLNINSLKYFQLLGITTCRIYEPDPADDNIALALLTD